MKYRNPWQRFRLLTNSGYRLTAWEHWRHWMRVPKLLATTWWRGFDYSEVWNLNDALAEFLAVRLSLLADGVGGAPQGYPNASGGASFFRPVRTGEEGEHPETDFEAWERDLRKHSASLAEWVRHGDCGDWWLDDSLTTEEKRARDQVVVDGANEAMRWVAQWWAGLWD